jgi:hypothetical protein
MYIGSRCSDQIPKLAALVYINRFISDFIHEYGEASFRFPYEIFLGKINLLEGYLKCYKHMMYTCSHNESRQDPRNMIYTCLYFCELF